MSQQSLIQGNDGKEEQVRAVEKIWRFCGRWRSPSGKQCWPQCSPAPWAPGWGWKGECESLTNIKKDTQDKFQKGCLRQIWWERYLRPRGRWYGGELAYPGAHILSSDKIWKISETTKKVLKSTECNNIENKVTHWWCRSQLVTEGGPEQRLVLLTEATTRLIPPSSLGISSEKTHLSWM